MNESKDLEEIYFATFANKQQHRCLRDTNLKIFVPSIVLFFFFLKENLSRIFGVSRFFAFQVVCHCSSLAETIFLSFVFCSPCELDFARKLTKRTTTMNKMAESYEGL